MDMPEDRTGSQNVPAGASMTNGTEVVLVDIRVASGAVFQLDSIANYSNDVAAFGTTGLIWTVLVDGARHHAFTRVRDQIGLQVNPRVLPAGLVKARNRFQIVCENDSAAAYTGGASCQGVHKANV